MIRSRHPAVGRTRRLLAAAVGGAGLAIAACSGPPDVSDPLGSLGRTEVGARVHLAAMDALDAQPGDEVYLASLHRIIWRPGFSPAVRIAAAVRLRERDPEGLARTLRQRLPRMNAWEGLSRLCDFIADSGWIELTPALVSSWARPAPARDDLERPEYLALVRLHREQAIPDVVFALLVESRRPSQQGLRTRCWELLHRIGLRDRLRALLLEQEIPATDGFLIDLQAGAADLAIVPHNREEIIWMRRLREPARRGFWEEAKASIRRLPPERAAVLELRDVPVVVSAARHDADLLARSNGELYARLDDAIRDRRHYAHGSNLDGFNRSRGRLFDWRTELTWGDLAAMLIAVKALRVPEVVDHLFDYAARDRLDESTEYGGVIALDAEGRFEILEFPPRIRDHDQKFIASQAMLDTAYTSIFHFHFHVQRARNEDFAGPGFGDVNYADNTRANCLVFTSVGRGRLNVDFYRHGRVVVDLGVIER